jgi:ketosteroid isomerase-like protein
VIEIESHVVNSSALAPKGLSTAHRRGTPAATGRELTAHIATFTQMRDGRIFRHATYDCYEPLG